VIRAPPVSYSFPLVFSTHEKCPLSGADCAFFKFLTVSPFPFPCPAFYFFYRTSHTPLLFLFPFFFWSGPFESLLGMDFADLIIFLPPPGFDVGRETPLIPPFPRSSPCYSLHNIGPSQFLPHPFFYHQIAFCLPFLFLYDTLGLVFFSFCYPFSSFFIPIDRG